MKHGARSGNRQDAPASVWPRCVPLSDKEHEALRPVADDLIERGAALAEQGAKSLERHAETVGQKVGAFHDVPLDEAARRVAGQTA